MARLLLLTTLAVLFTLAACGTDCYTKQDGTAVYSGTKSETSSGQTCQSWSSTSPNNHGYDGASFDITNGTPGLGSHGAGNYCRDPSGGALQPSGYLWCYTADAPGWGLCSVRKCPQV
ncbi:plasminogen-like [Haliotis cracherodii]|uniref:plasminogen-like n=1 Tax=Haliotis cracherodii TaxID=6455 RepID=UPI0039EC0534